MKSRWLVRMLAAILLLLQGCGSGGEGPTTVEDGRRVLLLNLGDSLTNGAQSNRVHRFTQSRGFTPRVAEALGASVDTLWSNPLLGLESGERIEPEALPTNLGVSGATIQSLLTERTGGGNPLLDRLLAPLPALAGRELTQLEAAEALASVHGDRLPLISLWIGNNDLLGAVTAAQGAALSFADIEAYLSDARAGRSSGELEDNLELILDRLGRIPGAQIFIANLPRVSRIAFLFDRDDIRRLSGLAEPPSQPGTGQAIGLGPFATTVAKALDLGAPLLNRAAAAVASVEANLLDGAEAALLDGRAAAINARIAVLATRPNVHLVDVAALYESLRRGRIRVSGRTLAKTFGAGGVFSLDGVHPSDTAHALIANAFLERIASVLELDIPPVDIARVLAEDPYVDRDGDGFAPGPGAAFVDPLLLPLADCDDTDPALSAPAVFGGPCP